MSCQGRRADGDDARTGAAPSTDRLDTPRPSSYGGERAWTHPGALFRRPGGTAARGVATKRVADITGRRPSGLGDPHHGATQTVATRVHVSDNGRPGGRGLPGPRID